MVSLVPKESVDHQVPMEPLVGWVLLDNLVFPVS